ncbi:MAG: hypothetical protein LBQ16_00270, partial [Gracilibacteraceae bacterium]|nr:hypothetical protein [Gracilibacteraceae bacterium]
CVGIYDDPANQAQPPVRLNLSGGNVAVVGSAQTGKTMLLQTVLRGVAESYSPQQVHVYILDFASKVMKIYENLNHVGGVLTDVDDEKLKNFFKMMQEEITDRKERFSQIGISSYEAYLETAPAEAMPHIIIMVDNLGVFRELFQDYEDAMLNICREGSALGVTVIATAKQTVGLSYKYLSNFATRLAFNCTESTEYNNVFDRCPIRPRDLPGRGLVSVDKVVYEYQAFLPFDGETESRRIEQARAFMAAMAETYGAARARAVPSIPPVLTEAYWQSGAHDFGPYTVPVGLTYREIEPVAVDLARVGTLGICGREGFGKSNLVRVLLSALQRHVFDWPCRAYLLDGYDRQLAEFETCGFVERFTVDCADFEDIVQRFEEAAEARMEILRQGGGLDSEPLLLCVVQNPQIYAQNTVDKAVSDRFKKLTGDAKQLKICFIFSAVDNNPEYSPPEIMKIARDFAQYFLLDDMANVKLFGSGSTKFNVNDKQYRKALALGDGYAYDARSGVERIKIVKCERSV